MTKLNQIIALEKGVKADAERSVTNIYHQFQRADAFNGLVRTYEPLEEDGTALPPESKKVTAKVPDLTAQLVADWTRLFDLTATKDTTNQAAVADIVVNGVTLVDSVPVTTLIWLEKRLVELKAIISKMPVTDIAEDWVFDADNEVWRSTTVRTLRQKKVTEYVTVAPATDKHPAQVRDVTKDVPEGYWNTTKLSGATSPSKREQLLARIAVLTEAVKKARETANMTDVYDRSVGQALFGFVFDS